MIREIRLLGDPVLRRKTELVERFGWSRPSLREALRILEAEGFIPVVRGVRGVVVVHQPDERMTARTAAMVLQSRNVALSDVFDARAQLEPLAARAIASSRRRRSIAGELRMLIDDEEASVEDPEAFGVANARFHERLVALAGNQTLTIVAEMLNEIVARAVTAVSKAADVVGSLSVRPRGIRSQRRPVDLPGPGDGETFSGAAVSRGAAPGSAASITTTPTERPAATASRNGASKSMNSDASVTSSRTLSPRAAACSRRSGVSACSNRATMRVTSWAAEMRRGSA